MAWYAARPRATIVATTPVVTVYPSQQFVVLDSTGYVVAQRKAAISSKVSGRLEWLGVAEGSRVKAGDVIARLDARDVKAKQDMLIRAPFDGVILSKSADVGDLVTPFSSTADSKRAVASIADMSTLEVEADVSRIEPGPRFVSASLARSRSTRCRTRAFSAPSRVSCPASTARRRR